jgi:hypothetical protein
MSPGSLVSRRARAAFGAVAAAALAGCETLAPYFEDPAGVPGYGLVAAFDASAVRTLEALVPEDQRPKPYEYIWTAPAAMKSACGPTKAPDGLGIFEAEAVGNRMMPSLVLVLESRGDVPALDTGRIRVGVGDGSPEVFLEPAVLPRYLGIEIAGDVAPRFKQQIKTQLQTYLCMEHKTGRAWQGGTLDQVRQALLLNPPDEFKKKDPADLDPSDDRSEGLRLPDRKFFGGQSEPVAALLGPPSTCIKRSMDLSGSGPAGGQGDSSLSLVPSDVWGASLAACADGLKAGDWYVGPRAMDLALSELPEVEALLAKDGEAPPKVGDAGVQPLEDPSVAAAEAAGSVAQLKARTWSVLKIDLRSAGEAPEQQMVTVSYEGREYIAGPTGAEHAGLLLPEQPLFTPVGEGEVGLVDMISRVPYRYPTVGPEDAPNRYTVLVIPNWQIVEAVRRLAAEEPEKPRSSAGEGVQDGVGWLLDHPDQLFVMVPRDPTAYNLLEPEKELEWLNIAGVMSGGSWGLRDWGYAAGMLAGRAPIALPGPAVPTWAQVSEAQRAVQHSAVLGGFAVLCVVMMAGLGRLRDLWVRVPEERVEFWPGPPPADGGGDKDTMGELSKASEKEE